MQPFQAALKAVAHTSIEVERIPEPTSYGCSGIYRFPSRGECGRGIALSFAHNIGEFGVIPIHRREVDQVFAAFLSRRRVALLTGSKKRT